MKYYYVMYDYEHEPKNVLVANDYRLEGIEDYDFKYDKKIKWNKNNIFYFSEDGVPDDYLAQVHPSARVVSGKIKDILEKELKVAGIEFFPVPLKHKDSNKVILGYYVMNVKNIIKDALDRERSKINVHEVKEENIKVETVMFYCLKSDRIRNFDIFKIGDGRVFVSDRVKKALVKAGVTGIDYGEVKLS